MSETILLDLNIPDIFEQQQNTYVGRDGVQRATIKVAVRPAKEYNKNFTHLIYEYVPKGVDKKPAILGRGMAFNGGQPSNSGVSPYPQYAPQQQPRQPQYPQQQPRQPQYPQQQPQYAPPQNPYNNPYPPQQQPQFQPPYQGNQQPPQPPRAPQQQQSDPSQHPAYLPRSESGHAPQPAPQPPPQGQRPQAPPAGHQGAPNHQLPEDDDIPF